MIAKSYYFIDLQFRLRRAFRNNPDVRT